MVSATDKYTRHSVHVTQLYTGTTADNQLAPLQNYVLPGDGTQGKFGLAANVLSAVKIMALFSGIWL